MKTYLIVMSVVIGLHLALRMVAVVGKARGRQRGDVHERPLFSRMLVTYVLLWAAAFFEGWHQAASRGTGLIAFGIGCYAAACALQWKALADLGEAYSPDIELRSEQRLVDWGVYAWVRHPLLLAGMLETVGLSAALHAPITSVTAALLFGLVVYERWQKEEQALESHFGDRYRSYRGRVGAFFPKWARS